MSAPPSRLRLRYRKDDVLMYISHLDLLRYLIKLLRRAEIPFATSGKFSPKPRLTFGPALPLGVTADNELLDVELAAGEPWTDAHATAARARLRDCAHPRDIIAGLSALPPDASRLNRIVDGARYELQFDAPAAQLLALLDTADLTCANTTGKVIDLRTLILSSTQQLDTLIIDGAARGDSHLNIMRLAEVLSVQSGATCRRRHRVCLLGSAGEPL